MKIQDIKKANTIKVGDLLLIRTNDGVSAHEVKLLKNVEDDIEVILNFRKNSFFSYFAYLDGKSWVKECRIVRAK